MSRIHRIAKRKRQKKATPKLVFEPDVDEPQTIESLAEQQRRFLAANRQNWVDVELPERFQKEDIEWALQQAKKDMGHVL